MTSGTSAHGEANAWACGTVHSDRRCIQVASAQGVARPPFPPLTITVQRGQFSRILPTSALGTIGCEPQDFIENSFYSPPQHTVLFAQTLPLFFVPCALGCPPAWALPRIRHPFYSPHAHVRRLVRRSREGHLRAVRRNSAPETRGKLTDRYQEPRNLTVHWRRESKPDPSWPTRPRRLSWPAPFLEPNHSGPTARICRRMQSKSDSPRDRYD